MKHQTNGSWFSGFTTMLLSAVVFITLMVFFWPVAIAFILLYSRSRSADLFTYFYNSAISIDQWANVVLGPILNKMCLVPDLLTEYNGVLLRFGHPDNTISEMLGIFLVMDGLSDKGRQLQLKVDAFFRKHFNQRDHCMDSINLHNLQLLSQ